MDTATRDLLTQIFVTEPNMRITLQGIKQHKFFTQDKDYWRQIKNKEINNVPYRPNPLKYRYLLQNKYETVSNLTAEPALEEPSSGSSLT